MENPADLPQVLPPEAIAAGGPFVLWIVFFFILVVTAGFAFALYYHWFRFGNIYPLSFAAMPVYGIGVLVLLGAMLTGIASI